MKYGRTRSPEKTSFLRPYLNYGYLLLIIISVATLAAVSYKVVMETPPGHQVRAWLGEHVPQTLDWLGFAGQEAPKVAAADPPEESSVPVSEEPVVNPHQGMGYIVKGERKSPPSRDTNPYRAGPSAWKGESSNQPDWTLYTLRLTDPNSSALANLSSQVSHQNIIEGKIDHRHYNRGISQSYGTATLNRRIRIVYLNASGSKVERILEPGHIFEVAQQDGGFLQVRMMGRLGWLPASFTE